MKPRALTLPPAVIARLPDVREVRVAMRPQPPEGMALYRYYGDNAPRPALVNTLGWFVPEAGDLWPCNDEDRIPCPYPPGSLAWVRETWGPFYVQEVDGRGYVKGGTWGCPAYPDLAPCVIFKADGPMPDRSPQETPRWCPSTTMRRWASRWTLYIEDVGVVQDGDWKWRQAVRPIRANVDDVLADPKRYGVGP